MAAGSRTASSCCDDELLVPLVPWRPEVSLMSESFRRSPIWWVLKRDQRKVPGNRYPSSTTIAEDDRDFKHVFDVLRDFCRCRVIQIEHQFIEHVVERNGSTPTRDDEKETR